MAEPYRGHKLSPEQQAEMDAFLAEVAAQEARQAAREKACKDAAAAERYARREAASYAWEKRLRTQGRGRGLPDPRPWPLRPRRKGLVPKRLRPRIPCQAHRSDGRACGAWAIHGGTVCWAHGGAAPQVQAAARRRLEGAAAADFMAEWARRMAEQREAAAVVLGEEMARLDERLAERQRQAAEADRRSLPGG